MQTRNPFNPTFGNVPPIFLDKQNIIRDLVDEIQHGYPQTVLYYWVCVARVRRVS